MSFFDDEGDEPPTRAARPRRPAERRTATARAAAGASDSQQLMVRRAAALAIGAVILFLLVLGVNGCLKTRAKNALKSYNRDVSGIVSDSNEQVSKPLFEALSSGQGSLLDLQQTVNQLRATADDDVSRARALSVPGDMKDAQYHLLLALTLRSEGVGKIADDIPKASGNDKRAAVRRIAGDMREFLASDVIFSQRIVPYIGQALAEHDIGGQQIASSQFLPDDTWLDPAAVGQRLGVPGASSSASGANATCANICGHGLTDVKVGDTTLAPAPATNRIAATATTAFTVDFQNQGQSDEFDVPVTIAVTGAPKTIPSVTRRVDETKAGTAAQATIRLGTTPPTSGPVRVKVTVGKVPGEKTLTNNTLEYVVFFTK